MKFYRFLLFCFVVLLTSNAQAADHVLYSNSDETIEIGEYIQILVDKTNALSLEDAVRSDGYYYSGQTVPNLEISTYSYWVKFSIKNTTKEDWLALELSLPSIDNVHFYSLLPDGKYNSITTGEGVPYFQREYLHQNYVFDLNIPTNETRTFLMKVSASDPIQLPLTLGTSKNIYNGLLIKDLIFGLYGGLILAMVFYNLFVYFSIKDSTYLYYVVYIFFVGFTQACLQGYTSRFLWPSSPYMANQSMFLAPALVGITALGFLNKFLQVKHHAPVMFRVIVGLAVAYCIAIILGLFNLHHESQNFLQVVAMIAAVSVFIVGFKIVQKGYRPAKFFLIAWSIFLISVIIFVLRNFNFLPYNNLTYYALQIGSALEVILLSLALADRINILKKEKEESQRQALIALTEKQGLIKEQNVMLEANVAERTKELKISNEELNLTLKNLKETQSQLVNAEKMASLGQLTAGVAHEINNPINFVSSSVKPLKRDINDLMSVLSKYDELTETNFSEKSKEIRQLKEELDMDYVREEIESLLKGIDEGASRTAEIVKGLKTFSRLDETDLKRVDLNEGIDSTLILLSSIMRGNVEVIKQYGDISRVECYAGKLNQVFMNILNNAVYAVLKKYPDSNQGKIFITTTEQEDTVEIRIKDNGTGIPDKDRNKIFDPFFTTKEVGEGTGLGLSIVYNIVESHNGEIKVVSEMGEGTEFIITLPKLQGN